MTTSTSRQVVLATLVVKETVGDVHSDTPFGDHSVHLTPNELDDALDVVLHRDHLHVNARHTVIGVDAGLEGESPRGVISTLRPTEYPASR
jgi:hypothetical protein